MEDRQQLGLVADILDQAGRHNDMVEAVKELAKLHLDLSKEERNLFSVAFKNLIGTKRAAWRVLNAVKGEGQFTSVYNTYRAKVAKEANDLCEEIFSVLDNDVIPHATGDENKVFFHKLKADYYRYLAEFFEADKRDEVKNKALESYEAAVKIGQTLPDFAHNPVYLGVALNFSVFQFEIMGNAETAIKIAKDAFDNGIVSTSTLPEEDYKDVTIILQLLRDNIFLWTAEDDEDDDSSGDD